MYLAVEAASYFVLLLLRQPSATQQLPCIIASDRSNVTRTKTGRVDPLRRADRIVIQVDATAQADGIHRYEPAHRRIVVPMPVVMQPRLGVMLLPLKRLTTAAVLQAIINFAHEFHAPSATGRCGCGCPHPRLLKVGR